MALAAVASLGPQSAEGRTLKTIYSFCAEANCADGSGPGAGLLMIGAGNFYGTTVTGGAHGKGTVFRVTLNPNTGTYIQRVLYDFCPSGTNNCPDGAFPFSTLVRDKLGNLFGTTAQGGTVCASSFDLNGCGTVFELIYNKTTRTYTRKVIHVFCTDQAGCADGSLPYAGLTIDAAGNLYGVSSGGGTNGDYGTVFKMTPANAARTRWTYRVLYKFCKQAFCADGERPYARLIVDRAGNLYGVTSSGGANDEGAAFALLFNKTTGKYTYKVLHSFCAKANCSDGSSPSLALTMDSVGNLFGTTDRGGTHNGNGTVFRLTPNASKTAWTHKVLFNFCPRTNCADGTWPYTNVVVNSAGKIFGTSAGAAGNANGGSIFQLTPNAGKTAYAYSVLKRFCTQATCADGSSRGTTTGLILDGDGNLFFPTFDGGSQDRGAVLELVND